jgi:hypothetical protein
MIKLVPSDMFAIAAMASLGIVAYREPSVAPVALGASAAVLGGMTAEGVAWTMGRSEAEGCSALSPRDECVAHRGRVELAGVSAGVVVGALAGFWYRSHRRG